jgi:hypothetical protein
MTNLTQCSRGRLNPGWKKLIKQLKQQFWTPITVIQLLENSEFRIKHQQNRDWASPDATLKGAWTNRDKVRAKSTWWTITPYISTQHVRSTTRWSRISMTIPFGRSWTRGSLLKAILLPRIYNKSTHLLTTELIRRGAATKVWWTKHPIKAC